jgi:Phospholipase_D-nuclease N-terminal
MSLIMGIVVLAMLLIMAVVLGIWMLPLLVILLAFGLAVFLFVFWIWMLIDCIKNENIGGTEKVVWVLLMIFFHFLGSLIYFFTARTRRPAMRQMA